MTSDTQNAATTGFPLVIPTLSANPLARLILRNDLGQVVQQWLVKQNKCTLGSAPSCTLRCTLPGIAPYHALLVVGARQTFVRALAPKLTRGGEPTNEILLADEPGVFEIAGHQFELSRSHSGSAASARKDQLAESNRLRFTLARPFALQNRSANALQSPAAGSGDLHEASQPGVEVAPWIAKLIQSAIEPLECQLHNTLQPISELQAEARRQKRSRRARRKAAVEKVAAERAEPYEANADSKGGLQQRIEEILTRQSGAMDLLAERITDVSQQIATIERVVEEERATNSAAQQTASKIDEEQVIVRGQQNAAIEQLQSGIIAVSAALHSLQERQQAVQTENVEWKGNVQEQLGAIRQCLSEAGDRQSSFQDSPAIVSALASLQASQAESHDEIKAWKWDVQQQVEKIRDSIGSASEPTSQSMITSYLQDLDQQFRESLLGVNSWKADVLDQLNALREALVLRQTEQVGGNGSTAQVASTAAIAETDGQQLGAGVHMDWSDSTVEESPTEIAAIPETGCPNIASSDLVDGNNLVFDSEMTVGWPQVNNYQYDAHQESGEALPFSGIQTSESVIDDRMASDFANTQIDSEFVFGDEQFEASSELLGEPEGNDFTDACDAIAASQIDTPSSESTDAEPIPAEISSVDDQLSPDSTEFFPQVALEGFIESEPTPEYSSQDWVEADWMPDDIFAVDGQTNNDRSNQYHIEGEDDFRIPTLHGTTESANSHQWDDSENTPYDNQLQVDVCTDREPDETCGSAENPVQEPVKSTAALPSWWSVDSDNGDTDSANDAFGVLDDIGPSLVLPTEAEFEESVEQDVHVAASNKGEDFFGLGIDTPLNVNRDEDFNSPLGLLENEDLIGLASPILPAPITPDGEQALAIDGHENLSSEFGLDSLEDSAAAIETVSNVESNVEQAAAVNSLTREPAIEEEDSVEDYMRKLLARMRGIPEEQIELPANLQATNRKTTSSSSLEKSTAANSDVDSIASTKTSAASTVNGINTPQLSGEITLPFDPENYVPRAMAPEAGESLTAMRELANTTARNAIHKSTRQRYVTSVLLKMSIAGVGLTVAAVLIAINGFNLNIGLIATFASLVVAAIWGYDAITGLKPLLEASFVLNPEVGSSRQQEEEAGKTSPSNRPATDEHP